jgi:hypothetical protein
MLVTIETADNHSSISDQFPDVDSIRSYVSKLGRELSQLELSKEEKEEIVADFQSSLFNGQESQPAAANDVYQDEFEDGEFEKGYEEKLYRRWMSSKFAERKEIAFEGHRTLLGLDPGAELRDKVVVKDLSDSAAKDDPQAGWSDYLQKLAVQQLQARFWR